MFARVLDRLSELYVAAWPIAAVAAGVGILVFLAIEISAGKTLAFDRAVLLAMRRPADHAPIGSAAFQQTARDISALGSSAVLSLLTGTVAAFLALDGKKRLALFLGVCVGTGLFLETILKDIFNRPRPDIVWEATYARGPAFPSGHAMMSAIVYLSLGALFAGFQRRRAVKAYVLSLAALLTILIGVTRVYLGVHWPTDVLAGWAAGAVWALLCWQLRTFVRGSPR